MAGRSLLGEAIGHRVRGPDHLGLDAGVDETGHEAFVGGRVFLFGDGSVGQDRGLLRPVSRRPTLQFEDPRLHTDRLGGTLLDVARLVEQVCPTRPGVTGVECPAHDLIEERYAGRNRALDDESTGSQDPAYEVPSGRSTATDATLSPTRPIAMNVPGPVSFAAGDLQVVEHDPVGCGLALGRRDGEERWHEGPDSPYAGADSALAASKPDPGGPCDEHHHRFEHRQMGQEAEQDRCSKGECRAAIVQPPFKEEDG